MRISVTTPVKNEFPWIGFSIMAAAPFVHEFLYMVADDSDDGTIELLRHLKSRLGNKLKFRISSRYAFNPMDREAYNQSFNDAILEAEGDACWFLHPDMILSQGADPQEGPLAWWTNITSYAGDFNHKITKGRATRWKNIHAKKFGLQYYGGYGSVNEDFYHTDITGESYRHYGEDFKKYPFIVADSGFKIDHFCELKPHARRLEKMKLCLKTQMPNASDELISEMAEKHPRVTLESTSQEFGRFEFTEVQEPKPPVVRLYEEEFAQFARKEPAHVS